MQKCTGMQIFRYTDTDTQIQIHRYIRLNYIMAGHTMSHVTSQLCTLIHVSIHTYTHTYTDTQHGLAMSDCVNHRFPNHPDQTFSQLSS